MKGFIIVLVTVAVHIFDECEVISGLQRNRNIIIYGGCGPLKATPSSHAEVNDRSRPCWWKVYVRLHWLYAVCMGADMLIAHESVRENCFLKEIKGTTKVGLIYVPGLRKHCLQPTTYNCFSRVLNHIAVKVGSEKTTYRFSWQMLF